MLLAVMACFGAGPAPAGAPSSYEIRPVLAANGLAALAVTLTTRGDGDGVTRLLLPTSGLKDGEGPAYVRGLTVEGGVSAPDGPRAVVATHRPGGRLIVRYQLVTGYDGDPPGQPFRPVVRPDWFVVHGQAAFVTVEGRDRAPAALRWAGLPKGWIGTSNLTATATGETLGDSLLIGGAGWRLSQGRMGSAKVSLWYRDKGWDVSPALATETLARVLQADFAYWGDKPRSLFVPVIQIGGGDFGGRGLAGGFMIFAGADADLRRLGRIVAHEHTHSWISRQVGGFPAVDDDLSAWFNEGFTEALAGRSLLRSGVWTLEDFAGDLNESLLRYGLSPVADAPNSLILEKRMSDFDVGKLPYDRGRLLAILWDRRLRQATGGRLGLDDVLKAQRRMAADNAARGVRVPANELFPLAARQATGIDLADDIAVYVQAGRRLALPADLFGDCGRVEEAEQPSFERGFDLRATFRNGWHVVGLIPGSAADRAGLRNGDRIKIDEIPSHDSQTPLTYRVVDPAGGPDRIVTYRPEGSGRVRFQRFVLAAGMDAGQRETCRRRLSGQS
jgi:predicted metalloprotease with PDZ domain